MPSRRRETAIPIVLGVAAFALAFAQRPGMATSDTHINLHVDPGRFLSDVASMWTSTGQLGDVQTGQQAGYLFPMGPFFALGHALGLSAWVVQRCWLGTLLALAALGVVRLIDALLGRPRGIAALTAGAVTILNPFVVTYANRTTVTLLAYAALPWLLLSVHRGLREPRGWRWPAAVALLVAASGGGINGAVTAWMLVGPMLLLLYEPWFTETDWRAVVSFLLRATPLIVLASVWWLIPAYVQSSYGIDFLHFTEQPGTVWGTTSSTETLRLMSFWLSYVGVGFTGRAIPYFDDARTLLFSTPVLVATLLLPAAALTGFVWTRRWRYGPFFMIMALAGLLVMGAGFPDGTPLRHGLTFTYNHVAAVRFLRASYKGAPLFAIALACLAGAGAAQAFSRLRTLPRGLLWQAAGGIAALAVLALAAWPLVTGRAQDAQVSFKRIPAAWRVAAADLDRRLPANSRAIVLPGDLFSFYDWGGTVDPILPALSRRPVAERTEVPYADPRATDLLWTIDALVHQQRLLPGQLGPLLALIGARSVITGTDDDLARSDAPAPADAAAVLAAQPGFANPAQTYGPPRSFRLSRPGAPVSLPQVRRYDLPSGRGLVHLERQQAPIVLDGSADGIAGLAAFGGLSPERALLYSGDLSAAELRRQLQHGGELVISDSNRRRAFVAGSLDQNTGPTLAPGQSVSADGITLDPFARGPDFQTVASYQGIASVQAPSSPQRPQFPEHAPFAAVDGSTSTAWVADPTLGAGRRWLQVDFDKPTDVSEIELIPYDDAGGTVRRVEIAGRSFSVHPGPNTLHLGLRALQSLRVTLSSIGRPAPGVAQGAGGIRELRIPGMTAGESLRLPLDAAAALRGANLDAVTLSYLFQRTTGDDPFHRELAHGPWSSSNVHDRGDAELTLRRTFVVPAARRFSASAWVSVSPYATDPELDRLAGYRGAVVADASGRAASEPGWRASRALDGDPRTAWIADYDPAHPASLALRSPNQLRLRALRLLEPSNVLVRRPTSVRISWPGGSTRALAVGPDRSVILSRAVRTRSLRIEILSAAAPPGASAADKRAVGIAELSGIGGLRPIRELGVAQLNTPCGAVSLRIDAARLPMRVSGTRGAFDAGTPLPAVSCGAPVALAAGSQQLVSEPGPFAVDLLRLRAPAPRPLATIALGGGQVLDPGRAGHGSYDHVRVAVTRPSWLVLGEGYNRGWQAWCDGHALGAPTPIDGYANGWRVSSSCHQVRFAFAPNKLAAIGYLVSAVTGIACLLILIGAALLDPRRRRGGPAAADPTVPADLPGLETADVPWRAERAIAVGLLAGGAFGFVFGLGAGAASVPAIAIILWRGIGARALTLLAGALLAIVVPLLYVLHHGDAGGNHYTYAAQHLAAHWVGVAAIGLLIAALWRTLSGFASARAAARAHSAPAASPRAGSPAA